ncbi:hypothetical protein [Pseudoalteromonas sp. McH1-42]|uniref:hypothetical protein n=1 Tax=Pseudoalteromonas sp. McH1-42 TaxID=2917752 RepID=UPI001EF5EA8F|nr:hypothetical protein [Pseudoalteromonas sp. McH1-42]MCG7564565.1 hypothetical protein [Pseudoalteromonas sp. McH1-42]
MILIANNKLNVDGVDVYPDHQNKNQFWYVPGEIKLAERNGKKELSYIWYIDSIADSNGTGFLNFEVNTAVSQATLDKITQQVASKHNLDKSKIVLSAVPYTKGNVNFSVLGPMAKTADKNLKKGDDSVLRVSDEQLVWSAGSSSLVGDNSAVCSVKFTKEGKLAAAMKQAIVEESNSISVIYSLDFLAMRPAISFSVKGTLEKTIKDFQASIGTQIPLESFILDLGIQAQWQRIMENTDLEIKVENYIGDETEGLKWAKQIVLDYVLKNFFEVQIGKKDGIWSPLTDAPEVNEAVQKAKSVEEVAGQKADEEGKTGEEKESAVKDVVDAAMTFIPKVNIRAAYYDGKQENKIDFLYTEMKATTYPALPQSLVLEGIGNTDSYISKINRADDPFGLPYPVSVVVPSADECAAKEIEAVNIRAKYPAKGDKQVTYSYSLLSRKTEDPSSFPFQMDKAGSLDVAYSVDYVFKTNGAYNAAQSKYTVTGHSENQMITALPGESLDFLSLDLQLATDFYWGEVDQVIVSLTSSKWEGEKQVVFNQGAEKSQTLKFRYDAKFKNDPIQYVVKFISGGAEVAKHDPEKVVGSLINVRDRFASHTPITFAGNFECDSAEIYCSYEDGEYYWDKSFTLHKGKKHVVIVPTLNKFTGSAQDLRVNYAMTLSSGGSYSGVAEGRKPVILKSTTLV